ALAEALVERAEAAPGLREIGVELQRPLVGADGVAELAALLVRAGEAEGGGDPGPCAEQRSETCGPRCRLPRSRPVALATPQEEEAGRDQENSQHREQEAAGGRRPFTRRRRRRGQEHHAGPLARLLRR